MGLTEKVMGRRFGAAWLMADYDDPKHWTNRRMAETTERAELFQDIMFGFCELYHLRPYHGIHYGD